MKHGLTYACALDDIGDFDEELLVLFCVLSSDKDLDGEPAALELFEVLRCKTVNRGIL